MTKTSLKAETITPPENLLGESPVWCERRNRVYWVDSRAPCLHVLEQESQVRHTYPLPELAGSICLREDGGLLVAMVTGIYALGSDGVLGQAVAKPAPNHPDNRFNDGRCDRAGRFWVGTLNDKERAPTGALWRIEPSGETAQAADNIIVPNSLAFSPDNRRMYLSDTYRHQIYVYDYDIDDGSIRNKQIFVETSGPGRPDGSAIDADGCLWNAEYAGGRIVRYTPAGEIDQVVNLPVSQPSCCAFGGSDFSELYITTARQRLSEQQLDEQPLAGSLFVVRPGAKGLPEGRFNHCPVA